MRDGARKDFMESPPPKSGGETTEDELDEMGGLETNHTANHTLTGGG